MPFRSDHPLARLAALAMALGVFVLALATVSPDLHAGLHAAAGHAVAADGEAPVGDAGHVCAVTLFAQGLTALLVFCLLALARLRLRSARVPWSDAIPAAHPRFRLVPAHAPPAV